MSSDGNRNDHGHPGDQEHSDPRGNSCCDASKDVASTAPAPSGGRSFQVSGLDCAEEVAILNRVVGPKVGGTEHLAFDVINGRMTILDSAERIPDDEVTQLVATTGMSAKPWDADNAAEDQAAHLARQKRFTSLSGGFWAAGFLFHIVETGMGGALGLFAGHGEVPMPMVEAGIFAVAILFGVWLVAPKAWSSARRLSPDMNLLMVVAVAGAIGLGEFFEAATVAFFFSLSLYLESWSVGRARNAVSALLDLAPPTARVLYDDGSESDVPAAAVAVNARFIVRGGDRIPLDGEVVDGAGAVDQAPITGESALVPKEPGDEVYAGTINGEGTLTVRATKAASDTVLAKIIRMVGDAHARRAPVEQWVAKFARIYTPIVMAMAIAIALVPPLLLGGAWNYWFYNALVLLVIACPCALVISTPVSIVAALTASARAGVLIKGGAYVEAPGRTTALAMDKTGTITMGEPEVAAVHPLGGTSARDLMMLAASLEARSSHPLARAILARAEADGPEVAEADGALAARAGILLPVLDEARRGKPVDAREDLRRERPHVLLLEHDRHGDDQREVLRRPLVGVLHREHGLRALAHEHDHGRVVVERGVGPAHVEAAERARWAGRGESRRGGREERRELDARTGAAERPHAMTHREPPSR